MYWISLIVLLLLFPARAFASLSVVQHVEHDANLSSSNTATIASTSANDLIVVQVNYDGSGSFSSITDSASNAYQTYSSASDVTNQIWTFYLPVSTAGITTVTTTNTNGSGTNSQMEVWEVSGWTTTPVADVGNKNVSGTQSGGTATGASVSTSASADFITAMDHNNGSSAITANPQAGNAFTSGGDIAGDTFTAFCSLISSSTGTYTPAWTDSGLSYITITASFKNKPSNHGYAGFIK